MRRAYGRKCRERQRLSTVRHRLVTSDTFCMREATKSLRPLLFHSRTFFFVVTFQIAVELFPMTIKCNNGAAIRVSRKVERFADVQYSDC